MSPLNLLRILAVLIAFALMIGEAWRSWGEARPLAVVWDDMFVAAALAISAVVLTADTSRRRAFFAAAWGTNAGMLYGSFVEKIITPESTIAGNWNADVLTILVRFAFAATCAGTIASILVPRE